MKIKVESGTKITPGDGKKYRLTDSAELPVVEVEKYKPQTNQHYAIVCGNKACRDYQRTLKNGRLVKFRGTRSDFALLDGGFMPQCKNCGSEWVREDSINPDEL